MKRKLLILCACLFAALTGVKAYTGVAPQVGKSYYLYSTEFNQFWYASSTLLGDNRYYGVTDNIAAATPIFVETAGDGYSYTFSFYLGGDKWFMNQYNGNTYLWKDGSCKFNVWADGEGKYYLRTQEHTEGWTTYRYYLNAESASGTCNFQNSKDHYCEWQFIAAEEAMTYMANHCASVAETNYVSGWERVTSVGMLKNNPENYFFSIFSSNAPALMVDASSSNAENTRPYYKTATNPMSSPQYLFEIENYESDAFALKSCGLNKYFGNNSDSWNFQNLTEKQANCKLTITLNDGAFNIQSANADWEGRRYWGLYEYTGYTNGQKFAGNKNDAEKGSFLVYRLPKSRMANVDMTALMPTGINDWTCVQGNGPAQYLETGATETYSDNGDTYKIFKAGKIMYQTVTNMPRGKYRVTFYAVVNSANNVSHASGPNLVQAYVNDETLDIDVVEQSSCTPSDYSRSITCTLDEYGSLEYGLKVKDGVTDAGNWALCKNVSLIYLGETLAQEASVFTSPSGVTSDIWNKYSTEAAGWYMITSNAATTLSYAQDGTKSVGDNDFSTLELSAGVSKCLNLSNNPLYFKSSNDATISVVLITNGTDVTSFIKNPNCDTNDGWDGGSRTFNNMVAYNGVTRDVFSTNTDYPTGSKDGQRRQTITLPATGAYKLTTFCKVPGTNNNGYAQIWVDDLGNYIDYANARHLYTVNTSGSKTSTINTDGSGWYANEIYFTANASDSKTIYINLSAGDGSTAERHKYAYVSGMKLTYLGSAPEVSLDEAVVNPVIEADLANTDVTIARKMKSDRWNTFTVPFNMDIPDGWTVKELTKLDFNESTSNYSLTFEAAPNIVAGKAYMVKPGSDVDVVNANGVTINTSTVTPSQVEDGDYTANFVGNNNYMASAPSGSYIISNNVFYCVNSIVIQKGFRGYITVSETYGARATVSFGMDDDVTGIQNVVVEGLDESGAQKDGKYLIDGKIVIVKNGVKYSANGQILK